jgi:Domain of unknown function (DUF4340)
MHWKTTGLLAALLLGLGIFYYVYEVREGPAREKAAEVKDRLWKDLQAKDIEDVVLKRESDTVHLKKSGERWTLVLPVASRADTGPVDALTSSLATTRVEREIDANPAKLADYGLETPAAEVTVTAKGQTHGLRLGAKNPTGTWVYAQEAGKPAVFLAPESLLQDAKKPVADFRDKTVLAFETKDVKGLVVRPVSGPSIEAVLKGADDWQLTQPLAVRADRGQITGLLDKLRTAKIKEFVAESPPSPAEYGLDRPLRLDLVLGEGKDRAEKGLRLGKAVSEKKAVYAQREGEPGVFLVDEELVKAVPTAPMGLRDKTVFAYDRAKAERVEIESPKGKVALALEGGAWKITAPAAYKADEGAVSDLLWKSRELKAQDLVAEDQKRLAAYGLDHPEVRLSVWEKDAKAPRVLVLTPAKEKGRAYAAIPGEGPVAAVEASALTDLGRSVPDLRDKSIFPAFEAKDATRVQIERTGLTLVADRAGEEDWVLSTPKKGKARGTRLTDLVWALRNLRWKEIVAEQGADPARYGLDQPVATLTVSGKDGKTLAALAVGKTEGGQTFVRVPGQPALYAIDGKALGDLPGSPEDLLL